MQIEDSENLFYTELFEPTFTLTQRTIVRQGYTPHLIIKIDNVNLPKALLERHEKGYLTLNISALAVSRLIHKDQEILLDMTVLGVPTILYVPYKSVFLLMAKENSSLLWSPNHPVAKKAPIDVKPTSQEDTKLGLKLVK